MSTGWKLGGAGKKGGGDTNASPVSVDCKTQMGPQSCVACSAERHSPSRLLPTSHLLFGCFHTSPVWSNSSWFARKGHRLVWGGVDAKSKSRRIKEANSATPKSSDLRQIQADQKQEVGRALPVNKTWSNVGEASCPALTEASCSSLVLFSYFLLHLFPGSFHEAQCEGKIVLKLNVETPSEPSEPSLPGYEVWKQPYLRL